MTDFLEYLEKRLNNDEIKYRKNLIKSEIREIMQGIVIPVLSENNFFENNAFLGGTALRMFYGLKRYSDDLDFTMKNNKIDEFSWKNHAEKIVEYGKKHNIEFLCKEETDKFGNKILRIRSDSILGMLDGKEIIPDEITNKGNREKIKIKLETNFNVNVFNDEIKILNNNNIRVLDLPSLFAGKINAVLTREETNINTNKKENVNHGRDWYDLIWYIDKSIKPNYNFLDKKLKNRGPFSKENYTIDFMADKNWVKEKLLERMDSLNYDEINTEIESITLKNDRIVIDRNLLINKISNFDKNNDS